MKRIYLGIILLIMFLIIGCNRLGYKEVSVFDKIVKEESYTKELQIDDEDKLKIESDVAEIIINQYNTDNVTIEVEEKIGGKDEKKVLEAMKKLDYVINSEEDYIKIKSLGKNITNSYVNSLNVKAIINIPNTIKYLEIESDVGKISINGEYEDIEIAHDVGEVIIDGNVNLLYVKNHVGDIIVDGNIKDYKLECDVGNIKLNGKDIK